MGSGTGAGLDTLGAGAVHCITRSFANRPLQTRLSSQRSVVRATPAHPFLVTHKPCSLWNTSLTSARFRAIVACREADVSFLAPGIHGVPRRCADSWRRGGEASREARDGARRTNHRAH